MTTTISGSFDNVDEARRAATRLEKEGIAADAIRIEERDERANEQPGGLRGVNDGGSMSRRRGVITVRADDAADADRIARLLQAAGGTGIDDASHAEPAGGLAAAAAAFGTAIAEAMTAPMSGATPSEAQVPASGTGRIGAHADEDATTARSTTDASASTATDPGGTGAGGAPAAGRRRSRAGSGSGAHISATMSAGTGSNLGDTGKGASPDNAMGSTPLSSTGGGDRTRWGDGLPRDERPGSQSEDPSDRKR